MSIDYDNSYNRGVATPGSGSIGNIAGTLGPMSPPKATTMKDELIALSETLRDIGDDILYIDSYLFGPPTMEGEAMKQPESVQEWLYALQDAANHIRYRTRTIQGKLSGTL